MVDFAKARAEANARAAKERLGIRTSAEAPTPAIDTSKFLTELELIDELQDSDDSSITEWEQKFVKGLRAWVTSLEAPSEKPLTPKQRAVLLKICVRCNIEMTRSPKHLYSPEAPTLQQYKESRARNISYDDMDDDIPF